MIFKRAIQVIFALFVLFPFPLLAAEFAVVDWRGHKVLKMTGVIELGDAAKFRAAGETVAALPHGLPVMLLDSPGGVVGEALRISQAVDDMPFHMVVPNGARCASACAALVFVGGTLRTVEHFGRLGQHSCAKDGVPHEECNEILAQHAIEHGVSHGSIAAFVTFTPPDQLLWFSREDVDGWGISRYGGSDASGWDKSEPRFVRQMTGSFPPAQTAWRIDFRGDGYEAFVRAATDHEREFEFNLYCDERQKGRLFLSFEIHGPAEVIAGAIKRIDVVTDRFKWRETKPVVHQMDERVSEITVEVPKKFLKSFLTKVDRLDWTVSLKSPYQPMFAQTALAASRKNLLFAANHCMNAPRDDD